MRRIASMNVRWSSGLNSAGSARSDKQTSAIQRSALRTLASETADEYAAAAAQRKGAADFLGSRAVKPAARGAAHAAGRYAADEGIRAGRVGPGPGHVERRIRERQSAIERRLHGCRGAEADVAIQ